MRAWFALPILLGGLAVLSSAPTGSGSMARHQGLTQCPKCKKKVQPTWKFCDKCGTKLVKGSGGTSSTGSTGGSTGSNTVTNPHAGHPAITMPPAGSQFAVPRALIGTVSSTLTRGIALDFGGSRIAFSSNRGNTTDLYICDVGGGNERQLTAEGPAEFDPDWSRDGRIVFVSELNQNAGLYIWENGQKDFESVYVKETTLQQPRWSPDGSQIAFISNQEGNDDLYVIDADGDNLRRLTSDISHDGYPSWCPLGCHIAFHSDRSGGYQIWSIAVRSLSVRQITKGPNQARRPSWGSNHRIAFETNLDGNTEVYTMNEAGTDLRRVTNNSTTDGLARFSGDGKRIAFVRLVEGGQEVFVAASP